MEREEEGVVMWKCGALVWKWKQGVEEIGYISSSIAAVSRIIDMVFCQIMHE